MDTNDADFKLALQLQEQFNKESESEPVAAPSNLKGTNNIDHILAIQLQEELNKEAEGPPSQPVLLHENAKSSIVDKFWELTDPNPDIHGLFLEFNASYFWNKLQGIEVRWSNRMTLCAGVCCYEGHGGLCSIRLSLPLLKLRPRKDLVETLLHEMIHAYLFVTCNNRDHDAHGPQFLKHMYRINKLTGANITVYHNFHDEVNEYRQHWWRCSGPCRHRPPYYGIVRRAMNRAPSANDFWWQEHQMTCGGTYEKIKEPEGINTKRKGTETSMGVGKKVKNENMNIKKYVSPHDENQLASQPATRHNTIISSPNKNSLSNIHMLTSPTKRTKNSNFTPFTGKGNTLGSSPLQDLNGINKKRTLFSYFQSSKSVPDKTSYPTKLGKEKESTSTVKKHPTATRSPLGRFLVPTKEETTRTPTPTATRGLITSPLGRLVPTKQETIRMPTKIDEIWLYEANTKLSQLKEETSGKMVLPDGKLSTASPLNHVKKIFMNNDNDDDRGSLHNWSLPDLMASNISVQQKQSPTKSSSLQSPILLDTEGNDSENTLTNIVMCPVCNHEVAGAQINSHLDECLSG